MGLIQQLAQLRLGVALKRQHSSWHCAACGAWVLQQLLGKRQGVSGGAGGVAAES
jgi:hypothetical protein